jgi:D-alanyl-D-alanine carboxypeptidase
MRQLIAQYLPQASQGPRTAPVLVADAGKEQFAEQIASTSVRLPRTRPELEELPAAAEGDLVAVAPVAASPLTVASIPVAPPRPAAAKPATPGDLISARISGATEVAELAYAPEFGSGEDPIARLTELAHARRSDVRSPTPLRDKSQAGDLIASSDGWYIQIGAVPTEEGAKALLDKAAGSMGSVLADADPVTQPVQKNGATIYRARFAGFNGKDDARAACAKLKSKSISCLAVPN